MTSVRGTATGVELRQDGHRITLHRQQALIFSNYIVDWIEQLERQEQQASEPRPGTRITKTHQENHE